MFQDQHSIAILQEAVRILRSRPELWKRAKERPSRVSKGGIVYFVQCNGPRGPVKIGFSARDAGHRLSEFLNGNPYPITVLAEMPGTAADEKRLHRKFKHLHRRGKWFAWSPELERSIQEAATNGKA